jgi:hypothetical protein
MASINSLKTFNIFSSKVLSGDQTGFLKGPDEIVLSRHSANVLFGEKDAAYIKNSKQKND